MINRKLKSRLEDKDAITLNREDENLTPSKGWKHHLGHSCECRNGLRRRRATFTILFAFCAASCHLYETLPFPARDDDVRRRAREEIEYPDGWEEYSYGEIRRHFRCKSRSKDDSKPLPSAEDWRFMRRTFLELVDDGGRSVRRWDEDDPVPPTLGYSLVEGVPVPPPYFAKASPGKGRGLFASRPIKEGELVHDGTHSDVVFPDAVAWRRFVFALGRDLACDCTDWHWMQKLERGGRYFLMGGLNISSLMNSGGKEFGPGRTPNALPDSIYSSRFYATRDIERYEEILTDYDSYYTNWKEVGL